MPYGCGSLPSCNEGLALVFLDRPALRPAPTLYTAVSKASACQEAMETYLSAEEAIRLAISEYLHVDCRLMQARQWGRVRSHWQEFSLALQLRASDATHLGLALDTLLAAQGRFIALLLLPWWRVALKGRRAGGGWIGTCRGLCAFVIHRAAAGGRSGRA